MHQYDVIIIGGGAAGLLCAITAGNRSRRVLVIEGSNKIGKKILMSGGGRCNFTNLNITPENYLSRNPHFCKSALSRYTQWNFIQLVEKHGIDYQEKKHGQLFCKGSSKEILAMLQEECDRVGVTILTECQVNNTIKSETEEQQYQIKTNKGTFRAESLVIASGGLSIPKMGASGFGYKIAEQFGINIIPISPALVPFTLTDKLKDKCKQLSGISHTVSITSTRQSFIEDMLFTHRGLSGPAVLQVSSYWQPGEAIEINFFPGQDLYQFLLENKNSHPKILLRSCLGQFMVKKLVILLEDLFWLHVADKPLSEISNNDLKDIASNLQHWQFKPSGTEGYRTAEVTMGGVDTNALSSRTMESNVHRGLYFIGEVVDVTGHLGGFNFQWAWSSGYAAGLVV
ncbi:MAG: NAD(P)/FAD-dependent oxidoreductase [Gammaproteobacteria bacterium]